MFDAGAIVGRLILDTSEFTTAATKATQKVEDIGQKVINTSRQLSRMAANLTYLGTAITAPIVMAFKSAEKYSNSTRTELEKFNNIFIGLRVSIAESLLPVMHQFGNAVADLTQRWQNLSPALRENMLRTALMTGVFLTLGGAISMVALKIISLIGYIIKLSGALMTFAVMNPELLLIRLAIVGIVIAMFKWQEVGNIVMNTLNILFDMAKVGFYTILAIVDGITSAFFSAATGALKFFSAITVNKSAKKVLQDLAAGAWDLAQKYNDLSLNAYKKMAESGSDAFQILQTGQSDFSQGFDDFKGQMSTWLDLFKNLGGTEVDVPRWQEASKTFAQGWQDAMDKTRAQLLDWGQTATNIFEGGIQTLSSGFSDLGMSIIGMGEDIQTVFANIGKSIIKMFMDILMKWLAMKVMMGIGSLVSSVAGAFSSVGNGYAAASTSTGSGLTNAFNATQFNPTGGLGFAEGTDSIPYNGRYELHEGEKVTPKYDATKGQGDIQLTLINNITPEAVATAMSGKEGNGVIVNTIDNNALRNGSSRRTIRRK